MVDSMRTANKMKIATIAVLVCMYGVDGFQFSKFFANQIQKPINVNNDANVNVNKKKRNSNLPFVKKNQVYEEKDGERISYTPRPPRYPPPNMAKKEEEEEELESSSYFMSSGDDSIEYEEEEDDSRVVAEALGGAMKELAKAVLDPLFAPGIEKGVDKDVIKGAGLLGAGLGLVTGGLAGAAILGTFGAYAAIAPGKGIGEATRTAGSISNDVSQTAINLANEYEAGQRLISSTQTFIVSALQVMAAADSGGDVQAYQSFIEALQTNEEKLDAKVREALLEAESAMEEAALVTARVEEEKKEAKKSKARQKRAAKRKEDKDREEAEKQAQLDKEAAAAEQAALEVELARKKAEEEAAEQARLEEEAEKARIKAEEEAAEQARLEEEAEKARIKAEEEAAEQARLEKEAEKARIKAEEEAAEQARLEEEAEKARIKAEEEAAEQARLEEEAEKARIKAEEEAAEQARLEARIKAEKEAEEARIKAEEEAEIARIKAEEEERLAAQAEAARLAVEVEEKAREQARILEEEQAQATKLQQKQESSDPMQQIEGESEDDYYMRMAAMARAAVDAQTSGISKHNDDDNDAFDAFLDDLDIDNSDDDDFWEDSIEIAQALDSIPAIDSSSNKDSAHLTADKIAVDDVVAELSPGKSEDEWKAMTVVMLKDELRARSLKVSGRKMELVKRLMEHDG